MKDQYPKRDSHFAHRYVRLLTKAAVAQEIGAESCWLLTLIVHQEDAKRYRGPVTFFNSQLMMLMGCSEDKISRLRTKCVNAGWLHYTPGGKRVPGKYWCTIPPGNEGVSDTPVDEDSPSILRGKECEMTDSPANIGGKMKSFTRDSAGTTATQSREKPGESAGTTATQTREKPGECTEHSSLCPDPNPEPSPSPLSPKADPGWNADDPFAGLGAGDFQSLEKGKEFALRAIAAGIITEDQRERLLVMWHYIGRESTRTNGIALKRPVDAFRNWLTAKTKTWQGTPEDQKAVSEFLRGKPPAELPEEDLEARYGGKLNVMTPEEWELLATGDDTLLRLLDPEFGGSPMLDPKGKPKNADVRLGLLRKLAEQDQQKPSRAG